MTKNLSVAGVSGEIGTTHFLNTRQKRYHCNQLEGRKKSRENKGRNKKR
jgi:hypothetical protein